MCTAYELGRRGGSFPARLIASAVTELRKTDQRLLRPTLSAPVVLADGRLEPMRWGFRRAFSNAVVNAREDKLQSRMWKVAFDTQRCLIPAMAYYEWSGPKGQKLTHRFTHADGELLWIAGIWEKSADLGACFSMITTEPTGVASGVHDRMPAVLSLAETGQYLDGFLKKFRPQAQLLSVADSANPLVARNNISVQRELF